MTDLLALLEKLSSPRLLVLGDILLDRYTWGDADRVSPEAPVLVVHAERQEMRLGGAAAVAALARGLDARVSLAGVVGADRDGSLIWDLLGRAGINRSLVFQDHDRITPAKERFLGRVAGRGYHPVLRIDHERAEPLTSAREEQLATDLIARLDDHDALLISDYAKGVCTPRLLERILPAAYRAGVLVLVDPARLPDYRRYGGADVLIPNRVEAELAAGQPIRSPDDASTAARRLRERYGVGAVLLKLDRDGMVLATAGQPSHPYPTRPREAADVTGAGDMVLAVVGLCRAAGASWDETVRLANLAAGLEVERQGVAPVSREELRDELIGRRRRSSEKLLSVSQMAALAESYRREGRTVVFTNGCFDLLHAGHAAQQFPAK